MKASLLTLVFILIIPIAVNAQQAGQVCTTNRNAPPISAYYWPPDTTVKVYFTRNLFTPEQRVSLFQAMTVWTEAAQKVGADVRFVDAGDSDNLINCQGMSDHHAERSLQTRPQALRVFLPIEPGPRRLVDIRLDRLRRCHYQPKSVAGFYGP